MKLLFAYFDCESNFDKSASYRGLGECGLNFSTTYEFVVEKEFVGNNNMPQYKLSCHKKTLRISFHPISGAIESTISPH